MEGRDVQNQLIMVLCNFPQNQSQQLPFWDSQMILAEVKGTVLVQHLLLWGMFQSFPIFLWRKREICVELSFRVITIAFQTFPFPDIEIGFDRHGTQYVPHCVFWFPSQLGLDSVVWKHETIRIPTQMLRSRREDARASTVVPAIWSGSYETLFLLVEQVVTWMEAQRLQRLDAVN